MGGEIGGHQDAVPEVVRADHLCHRGEVLGVLDVLFREGHAAVRPLEDRLVDRLLVGPRPRHVDLEELRRAGRVLAGLPGAFLVLRPEHPDLLVRGTDGDDPVGELSGLLRVDRPRGCHIDRDRLLGPGVELGALEGEVLALVLDHVAGEQLVDDLDALEQHRAPDADLRPDATNDVLVQGLAGTEPQVEATREHRPERRRRMGNDRRVIPKTRTGHRRPERQGGTGPERAHERPGEGALALLRGPGVEVLADHEAGVEAGGLGLGAPVEQVRGVELFEHRRVADLCHGRCSPALGRTRVAMVAASRLSPRRDCRRVAIVAASWPKPTRGPAAVHGTSRPRLRLRATMAVAWTSSSSPRRASATPRT